MNKKILFIIPNFSIGGTNTSLVNLVKVLAKENIDITIFSLDYSEHTNIRANLEQFLLKEVYFSTLFYSTFHFSKFDLRHFLIKFIKQISILFRIDLRGFIVYKFLRNNGDLSRFDTIVAFQEGDTTNFVSRISHTNKISWIHCNYNFYLNEKFSEEDIYSRFNKIILVSHFTLNIFNQRYPNLKNRTIVVYNYLDMDYVRKLSLNYFNDSRFIINSFNIISIGRIDPIKQFHLIPEFSNYLRQKGLNFTWYIIGPSSDKSYFNHIHSLIQELDLSEFVKLMGSHDNPYPYYVRSHLVVSLSISEANPMIFMEAKALGIPVLSNNFPTSYEFLQENISDIICSLEDIPFHIERFISDKLYYSKFKNNASKVVFVESRVSDFLFK